MASMRFLIVPVDSSAASRPLPDATMARATLLRSVRFIGASPENAISLSMRVKLDGSRATTKQTSQKNVQSKRSKSNDSRKCEGGGEAGLPGQQRPPSRDFRIEFALDITLRHLGGGQHFLDLAGLPS